MTERFDRRTRALLDGVRRHGSVSGAAREMGIDVSNALRHLRAAEVRAGAVLVERSRGGRGGGRARLTAAGAAYLAAGTRTARDPHHARWVGEAGAYDPRRGVTPVRVGRLDVVVAGRIPEGGALLDVRPQDVALHRPDGGPTRTSVQNAWPARVAALRFTDSGVVEVRLEVGGLRLESLVTRQAVRELRLRQGSRVTATVKATAVRVTPVGEGGYLKP